MPSRKGQPEESSSSCPGLTQDHSTRGYAVRIDFGLQGRRWWFCLNSCRLGGKWRSCDCREHRGSECPEWRQPQQEDNRPWPHTRHGSSQSLEPNREQQEPHPAPLPRPAPVPIPDPCPRFARATHRSRRRAPPRPLPCPTQFLDAKRSEGCRYLAVLNSEREVVFYALAEPRPRACWRFFLKSGAKWNTVSA